MKMTIRLKNLSILAAALVIGGWCTPSLALTDVVNNDQIDLGVGGRLQLMGYGDVLQTDPYRSTGRLYLFLKQSRLELGARHGDYRFYSQLALGGEDVYTSNTNLTLLDMFTTGPLCGLANWRVGQFRVPYGRELMSNGGRMAFNDRSVVSSFFLMGRDVGASLQGNVGPASIIGGLFTGGGRDIPGRYLPEVLGIPLLAARVSIGDVDNDPYDLGQHDNLDTQKTRQGWALSGVFTRDSLVGHSSVLNIKDSFDKSLLLNAGWNPYIGKKDPTTGELSQGQLFQTSVDYAVKTPLLKGIFANSTLSGEAELNYGHYGNAFGALGVFGGRVQAGIFRKPFEASLRYALLAPDAGFAATNTTAGSAGLGTTTAITPDGSPIHEITPSFAYLVDGDRLKLTLDFPILLNTPVVTEKGLGSYDLVNQPDQTALVTNAATVLSRQFDFQVRGVLQYAF
jgi:hypothetical protein